MTSNIKIKNIRFEYEDGALPNPNRENAFINNVNMWLQTVAKEFNEQDGIVEVYFKKNNDVRVIFDKIPSELYNKIIQETNVFRRPH